MEDLFKILFYTVAVVIWIIYKFRQQKKSGMWKPRIDLPVQGQETKKVNIPARPVAKPMVPKSKPSSRPSPSREREVKTVVLENPEVTEGYNTSFLREMVVSETGPGHQEEITEQDGKAVWMPDIRKAILAAEILKRPEW